jgi:hypothetical protein
MNAEKIEESVEHSAGVHFCNNGSCTNPATHIGHGVRIILLACDECWKKEEVRKAWRNLDLTIKRLESWMPPPPA